VSPRLTLLAAAFGLAAGACVAEPVRRAPPERSLARSERTDPLGYTHETFGERGGPRTSCTSRTDPFGNTYSTCHGGRP
jgi:hypothetical protein